MKGSEKMQEVIKFIIDFVKIIFESPVLIIAVFLGFIKFILTRKRGR